MCVGAASNGQLREPVAKRYRPFISRSQRYPDGIAGVGRLRDESEIVGRISGNALMAAIGDLRGE